MITQLVLATHNKGKVAEISDMLAPFGITVLSAGALGLAEPAETETTFVGNALIKARAAAKASELPCLADDSGLCVAALKGDPGVYSADWAGPDKNFQLAMQKVWDGMKDAADKSAYFISVLALVMTDGSEHLFEGRCQGQIVWPPRGDGGFGYDPIFVADGETRTFGEMTISEKKAFSQRGKAFDSFKSFLLDSGQS